MTLLLLLMEVFDDCFCCLSERFDGSVIAGF